LQDRLIFVIGSPRSGSTMLARMLGAHSAIHAPAEPHLLTPLAHLGFYASVERAPYDPIITRQAIHEVVRDLPRGEEDYLAALRAYTDAVYGGLLAKGGRRLLLDKTPAYALVLDFAARLYPEARYVVLTRHPFAVWTSFIDSFFDGDHEVAHSFNPLLERYVPAIARFLRERPVPLHHVRYEELVSEPEAQLRSLSAFLGVEFEPGMVSYGESGGGTQTAARGLGDPMTVARETRPTTRSVGKWAAELEGQPARLEQYRTILDSLPDEDLEAWGFDRRTLEADLASIDPSAPPRTRTRRTRYTLERSLLVRLRRNIHHNAFGRLVRRVRFACDVLLR
jgi:hypothetical protein